MPHDTKWRLWDRDLFSTPNQANTSDLYRWFLNLFPPHTGSYKSIPFADRQLFTVGREGVWLSGLYQRKCYNTRRKSSGWFVCTFMSSPVTTTTRGVSNVFLDMFFVHVILTFFAVMQYFSPLRNNISLQFLRGLSSGTTEVCIPRFWLTFIPPELKKQFNTSRNDLFKGQAGTTVSLTPD